MKGQRAAHLPVTIGLLQVKYMEHAREKYIATMAFEVSRHWVHNFMRHTGLNLQRCTLIPQKLLDAYVRYQGDAA